MSAGPPSTRWDASWALRVIERHQHRLDGQARRITIDLDPTDDATHGAQQLTFFNGHDESWCSLPLLAFLTFDQEREQYLCAAVLRPGHVPATRGTVGVLCRLLPLLRQAFPQARLLVRLDGGFATPEIFDVLDAEPRLDYVVAMAKNAVLQRHAEPAPARGAGPERGQRPDRARLRRHPLSSPHVGPRPPHRDQGRGRPARRPRAARQPALRRDQPAPDAAFRL